jgi:hypothetical protein
MHYNIYNSNYKYMKYVYKQLNKVVMLYNMLKIKIIKYVYKL